ncbi:MAG: glycosyltransferase [candidate division KSB1 bacterium]|jgi:GT2 family glycosyltransferase/lipopolysaccharide/colanic/teichoic acid biosynthesis glycosyltransferase|nr:glycosyltransferase [candidate division KSB1 bacterium]
MTDISIIIVNYNVKELLEQSLLSVIKAARGLRHEIFVVDNASTDGSVELIRDKFPDVTLIANATNKGFAAANNQALKLAKGKYVVLLNPDTVVQEDTFTTVKRFLDENKECGMVGCKILNPDGSLQLACRRSFPTLWVGFTRIIGLSRLFPRSRLFGRYNLTYLDPDETYEVEAISGSFMVVRNKVVKQVGMLDESFFMYGEDLDWCFRIKEAGWKIYYLPETKIIHFKGESSKQSKIDLTIMFYRAMKLFVEKHYHSRYFYVPQWFLVSGIVMRAGITFLGKFIRAMTPAIFDLLLLNVSLIIALFIRFGSLVHLRSYLVVTMIYSLIWLACIAIMGGYGRKKYSSIRAMNGVIVGFILNASITFFFNQYAFSRAVVLISGTLNILFIGGWRFVFKFLPRLGLIRTRSAYGKAILGRRTLVVGSEEGGEKIIQKLRSRVDGGYQVTGLVTLNGDNRYNTTSSAIRRLGSLESLDGIIQQEKIQEVIFSTEDLSYDKILEIMAKIRRRGVNFKLIPSSMEVIIGKATIDRIGALPLIDIDYRLDKPMSTFSKRLTDIFISLAVLFLALPVLFYLKSVKKIGMKKKKILTYEDTFVEVDVFDPRKVSMPEWIRYLPYFKYVLSGDLSIVGSEMVEYSEKKKNAKRIALKPGLVGLVQLNRDSAINAEDKQRYDLFYLKNYSPVLDMEIILKSIFKI